ncbi:MAG: hypothetical protein EOO90_04165 [Pedobacter sp.]|nr:MAG: hypothetical protein EOO90_04165 [Pedobacter sp.]
MNLKGIFLVVILMMGSMLSFAQYVNYEVKVILDSVKNVKGTLQKVSPEGIAISDYRGNYYIFRAKNIVKIKVRKKGLTTIEGLSTGAGIGLVAGAAIFFSGDYFHDVGTKIGGTAIFTGIGAIGGVLGGLVGEALNTKLILNIRTDTEKYNKEYLKLEKYSKSYYLDRPTAQTN